ncbi:MAG: beta-ketoacyl-ACP synthase II [Candidatus Omnitrophica bacterium]|nr:beta-ketoacyl-ACP synthase II [Candidatus Omnitrophota bacterium]MDE2221972.1 beta-ketoacyl-ACP synthase II [Candidatus Omnitrophota bacterium]
MHKNRVVITGMGVLSPVGCGIQKFWQSILAGQSGIRPIAHFDAALFDSRVNGDVIDYDPLQHFNSKDARNLSRFIQFGVVAAHEALAQAGLDIRQMDTSRAAVVVGSGIGSIYSAEEEYEKFIEKGPSRISPFFITRMIINEAAGQIAINTGASGPCFAIATACATANNCIGEAMRMIQHGEADVVIAGGTESATSKLGVGGFCALKALSKRNDEPAKASRPFDLNRDGFVMGEGAGIVVLESLEFAQKRGAKILAELAGYGRTCDAYHITAPHAEGLGALKAMEMAIKDAGLKPTDINYINAHGTSTKLNDSIETLAIKKLFGDHAKKVPISSTKSMTGHLLGAAGGVELVACIMSILENKVHPTINYETPDPECDLDYVPNVSRQVKVDAALSNSLGFGGHNATLIVKRFKA